MACHTNPREDWIPPESRNIEDMKQNTGETSAKSFVYFPKKRIEFIEGIFFNCIEIPEETQLYRSTGLPCGELYTDDEKKTRETRFLLKGFWFSDYTTAKLYGKTKVYAYTSKKPLYLLNIIDKDNIKILKEIEAFRKGDPTGYYDEIYNNTPYIDPYNGNVDSNEEDKKKVVSEFNYGGIPVLRKSAELDKPFADVLFDKLFNFFYREIPKEERRTWIDGFYSPVMPSAVRTACPVNMFHREIFLFNPNLLTYNPKNKLDSCYREETSGGRFSSLRRKSRLSLNKRKTTNRSSLRPKNRSRTNRNRRSF